MDQMYFKMRGEGEGKRVENEDRSEEKKRICMDAIDMFIPIRSVQISLGLVRSVVTDLSPNFFLAPDL